MTDSALQHLIIATRQALEPRGQAPAATAYLPPPTGTRAEVAALIDHTILKPEATSGDVRRVCEEAKAYQCASACVNSAYVPLALEVLAGQPPVCAVVGFPLGAASTGAKVAETQQAIAEGAREIDMVLRVGELRAGSYALVRDDIAAVAQACHQNGATLKVILETALLDDTQKAVACVLAELAGADFVKTSTGFSTAGATVADVSLMRQVVGDRLGVKASGGVRTLADLRALVAAGASRVGASASVAIIEAVGP